MGDLVIAVVVDCIAESPSQQAIAVRERALSNLTGMLINGHVASERQMQNGTSDV